MEDEEGEECAAVTEAVAVTAEVVSPPAPAEEVLAPAPTAKAPATPAPVVVLAAPAPAQKLPMGRILYSVIEVVESSGTFVDPNIVGSDVEILGTGESQRGRSCGEHRIPVDAQTDPTTPIPTFAVTSPTTAIDGGGATSFPTSDFVKPSYLPTYGSSLGGTGGGDAGAVAHGGGDYHHPVELISAPSTGSSEAATTESTETPAVAAESTKTPVAPVPTPSVTEASVGATASPVGSGGPVMQAKNTSSLLAAAAAATAASLCIAAMAAAVVWTMY